MEFDELKEGITERLCGPGASNSVSHSGMLLLLMFKLGFSDAIGMGMPSTAHDQRGGSFPTVSRLP
jgi:hypothetical protein